VPTHTYHPEIDDDTALLLVRNALIIRATAIEVVASAVKAQPGAPKYGTIVTPSTVSNAAFTSTGLGLVVSDDLPDYVVTPWGALRIGSSSTEELEYAWTIIERLGTEGIELGFDDPWGDPRPSCKVISVKGTKLPPAQFDYRRFKTFTQSVQSFQRALHAVTSERRK